MRTDQELAEPNIDTNFLGPWPDKPGKGSPRLEKKKRKKGKGDVVEEGQVLIMHQAH